MYVSVMKRNVSTIILSFHSFNKTWIYFFFLFFFSPSLLSAPWKMFLFLFIRFFSSLFLVAVTVGSIFFRISWISLMSFCFSLIISSFFFLSWRLSLYTSSFLPILLYLWREKVIWFSSSFDVVTNYFFVWSKRNSKLP